MSINQSENLSICSHIARSNELVKTPENAESIREVKKAPSLIDEVLYSQAEPRFRYRSDYSYKKFVIYPDDTFKFLWDILILL